MKFEISGFLFVLMWFSPSSRAEVTDVYFSTAGGAQGATQSQSFIQQRKSSSTTVYFSSSTESFIQERPRGVANLNPNSNRSQVIQSKGGVAATQICGGAIEITNLSGQCNELEYDKDFLNFMHNQGLVCAREASRAAFGFNPTQIKFLTGEGQVAANRKSSNGKYSTHSTGRAVDVFEVKIYNGRAFNSVKMHGSVMNQRAPRTFYHGFRDCWKKAIQSAKGGVAGTCGSGCLDYNHANHWDHMHISLPPLDNNRRNYGVNCT